MIVLTKYLINFFLAFILISCQGNNSQNLVDKTGKEVIIPAIDVLKETLKLNGNEGKWYLKEKIFTGYAVKYHSNGVLAERIGFYHGKKEGLAQKWFLNGQLKKELYYKQNKIEGQTKIWWENGILALESYYINGKVNGFERWWYKTGQLSKSRNLADGKEVGMQQAWLKNGKLYVNYEAKNGRIFGLKRANLCYSLEDEIIVQK
jgi:antitoxin component YwqK of YwqJK toxin-antitoxin module